MNEVVNRHVFAQSLRSNRVGLVWYGVAAALIVGIGVLGADAAVQQAAQLQSLLKSFPPALLEAFGVAGGIGGRATYIAARALGFLWPLAAVAYAAGSASAVVAMFERGSLHFELALPVRRAAWLLSRVLAAAVGLFVLVGVSLACLYLAEPGAAWWRFGVLGLAFGFAWLGLAYAALGWARERGAVGAAIWGLWGLAYGLFVLSRGVAGLRGLESISLWTGYQPTPALVGGVPWGSVAVYLLVGGLGLAVGLWRFSRRDLPA